MIFHFNWRDDMIKSQNHTNTAYDVLLSLGPDFELYRSDVIYLSKLRESVKDDLVFYKIISSMLTLHKNDSYLLYCGFVNYSGCFMHEDNCTEEFMCFFKLKDLHKNDHTDNVFSVEYENRTKEEVIKDIYDLFIPKIKHEKRSLAMQHLDAIFNPQNNEETFDLKVKNMTSPSKAAIPLSSFGITENEVISVLGSHLESKLEEKDSKILRLTERADQNFINRLLKRIEERYEVRVLIGGKSIKVADSFNSCVWDKTQFLGMSKGEVNTIVTNALKPFKLKVLTNTSKTVPVSQIQAEAHNVPILVNKQYEEQDNSSIDDYVVKVEEDKEQIAKMTFVANLNRSAKDYCNDINPGATMEEYAKHLADKKGYSVVVYEDYGDIGMLITMQCNNIIVHCEVHQDNKWILSN